MPFVILSVRVMDDYYFGSSDEHIDAVPAGRARAVNKSQVILVVLTFAIKDKLDILVMMKY